jgi:hypothetical protein
MHWHNFKDATFVCELLDEFVREVGVQHVVQVVINNVYNYVAVEQVANGEAPHIVLDSMA